MIHQLTTEEIAQVYAMYPGCRLLIFDGPSEYDPVPDKLQSVSFVNDSIGAEHTHYQQKQVKLLLKDIKHISTADLLMLCYWVSSEPFVTSKKAEFNVEYRDQTIVVRCGIYAYHVYTDSGNVHFYIDSRVATIGNNANAFLFYMKYYYAFPMFFEKGHWANHKTPLQLGIAVPDITTLTSALMELHNNNLPLVQEYYFDRKLYKVNLYDPEIFDSELSAIKRQLLGKRSP